ncbi:hypothetical protein BD410DRAFT_44914 [Rickenella mellea]|uniref:Uncharacterized protein n=1 Tax=Rickenella mellea TaxID=50990 RepID=A0A4R5XFF4_9AGAM|nr:hypothetical protein BD410DRAFT_44914 [Rickenella mellea]
MPNLMLSLFDQHTFTMGSERSLRNEMAGYIPSIPLMLSLEDMAVMLYIEELTTGIFPTLEHSTLPTHSISQRTIPRIKNHSDNAHCWTQLPQCREILVISVTLLGTLGTHGTDGLTARSYTCISVCARRQTLVCGVANANPAIYSSTIIFLPQRPSGVVTDI